MTIEYEYLSESKHSMSLEEFADKHNLIMVVKERARDFWPKSRFYAQFKNAEVKEGACLRGTYGNGETELRAITAYASEISGHLLVVDAFTEKRLEIQVPELTFQP